jgi:uncharacterized protein YcbX
MATSDMRVRALYRYPVKSMQGERLDAATIGPFGIIGDRQWGLVDLDTGLMLTARREPQLLFARARLDETSMSVRIELPDGTVTADDAALSSWVGRPIELRRADPEFEANYEIALTDDSDDVGDSAPWVQWTGPRGSFHDSTKAQVSLVAEGTLRAWDVRRFRPNVVVTGEDGSEDGFVGGHLRIGSATFDVLKQIDRCVMTTRAQPPSDLSDAIERDLGVLKTINAERATFLAVGMMVAETGTITIADRVDAVASSSGAP